MSQNDLLNSIFDAGAPVSAKDVGTSAARLRELEAEGVLERPKKDSVRKTGSRGRPSHLYRLTRKASDRIKRERKASAKASKSAPVSEAQAVAA